MYKDYPIIGERIYSGAPVNGLNVFVVPKPGFHKSFALFAANYGSADRRFSIAGKCFDTPLGVAHFLEHKMFDTEDGDALAKLTANGASANAYTSTDTTAYHFGCVDKFTENLEILLSFVSTAHFTHESVEKERGVIGQEILTSLDDPDHCLYFGLMESLFKHSPLRDPVAGTVESIAEITAETLYDCHKAFYCPSNMVLCITGDVSFPEVLETAERILPKGPGDAPERDYGPPESEAPESMRFSADMDISLPIFLAGCKAPPAPGGRDRLRRELVAALALEVLAGHSSPLYFRLYSDGLISGDFAASFDDAAGAAYTMFGGETRQPQRVFDDVLSERERLTRNGPDPALFSRLKKALLGSHVRALNSFGTICDCVADGCFLGYDAFEAPEILASITEDEAIAFLRESLSPDNMAMSIINPKE